MPAEEKNEIPKKMLPVGLACGMMGLFYAIFRPGYWCGAHTRNHQNTFTDASSEDQIRSYLDLTKDMIEIEVSQDLRPKT